MSGGNSFQNYSQKDQAVMFNQAGGKDKFIQQAIATQAKYPRGLDYQKYLDRAKQYQAGQILGGQEKSHGLPMVLCDCRWQVPILQCVMHKVDKFYPCKRPI